MGFMHRLFTKILPRQKASRVKENTRYCIEKIVERPKGGGGYTILEYPDSFEIHRGLDYIKISKRHAIYITDIMDSFDYYFYAVDSHECNGKRCVNYSIPAKHKVKDFDLFEVMFSSFAEGNESTIQYIEFAQLQADSVVFDLGAYSGLTSIQFDIEIAKDNPNAQGRVIAVDADSQNIPIISYNLEKYKHISGRTVEFIHSACSDKDEEVEFSSEGNMGAALVDFVGRKRADKIEYVPGIRLSTIAKKYNVPKVDFIKCDIEGGELVIFKDKEFFNNYSPRIIFEPHYTRSKAEELTAYPVMEQLAQYGYRCRIIPQNDVSLPLVECVRE